MSVAEVNPLSCVQLSGFTSSPVTSAREHYEKDTGIKNGMSEMLHNHPDLDLLAKWMTRYSSGVAVPMGMGFYELNNKE